MRITKTLSRYRNSKVKEEKDAENKLSKQVEEASIVK